MKRRGGVVLISLLLAALAFTLTGCSSKSLAEPKNITYDGQYVRWEAVDKAEYYMLKVDEGKEVKVTSNEYLYQLDSDRDFSITVRACAEGKEDSADVTMAFKPLGAVGGISVEDEALTWAPTENADSYLINMDGESVTVNSPRLADFDFTGTKTVKIMPLNSSSAAYYGRFSQPFTFSVLEAPKNLAFDSKTISWDAVPGKDYYKLAINGTPVESPLSSNRYVPGVLTGEVKLSVMAVGDNSLNIISSAFSDVVTYRMLEKITEIDVTDGILSWPEVENADFYLVELNGTEYKALTNKYTGLNAGTAYSVSVRAMCNKGKLFYSPAGDIKTVKILQTASMTMSVGVDSADASADVLNISVQPVDSAASYKISWTHTDPNISGSATVEAGDLSYKHKCEAAGDYTFTVQSLPAVTSESYPSKVSAGILVKRQQAPTGASLVSDPVDRTPRVNVTLLADASSFDVTIDGAGLTNYKNKAFQLTMPQEVSEQKIYTVSVRAAQDLSDANNLLLRSRSAYEFTVTRLAKTARPEILNDDTGGLLQWNAVSKANGYAVYAKNAADIFDNATEDKLALTGLAAGTYDFRVQARGNGSDVLASALSDGRQVTKLAAPTGISRAEQDKTLTWNTVAGATGYTLNVNGTSKAAGTTLSYTLEPELNTTVGVAVLVRALGNDENGILNSEFSPVVTCYRLQTPDGLTIDGSGFKWNAVDHASQGYDVYSTAAKNVLFTDRVTRGTSVGVELFRIESEKFENKEYTLSVRAIGSSQTTDGKIYFDSEISPVKTFTRLAAPIPSVSGDGYVWTAVPGAKYDVTCTAFTLRSLTQPSCKADWASKAGLTAGLQKITFTSVGDNDRYLSSAPVEYTQYLEPLNKPSFTAAYFSGRLTVTPAVNSADAAKGVTKFIVNNGSDNAVTAGNSYDFAMDGSGVAYSVYAKTVGNYFGSETKADSDFATYYLSSAACDSVTYKRLTAPQNVRLSAAGALQWNAVNGASGYEVIINGAVYTVSGTTFAPETGSLTSADNMSVRALGNGKTTFDSEQTAFV